LTAEDGQTLDQVEARRAEPDLLAEGRARRAAESAAAASTHRAEAAEATIRTLEGHVASLRERLHEAAELTESSPLASRPRLVVEHAQSTSSRPDDAGYPLRPAAERRWLELDRRNRAEIDRLTRRLSNSERHARELAGRLERARRELAASDRLLERVRRGHRQLEVLLGQARATLSRLSALVADPSSDAPREPFEAQVEHARIRAYRLAPGDRARDANLTAGRTPEAPVAADAAPDPRADELDAALAVAVERLRRRAVADTGVDTGAQPGSARTSGAPVAMSPSREPLLAPSRLSWWVAWRARWRAHRRR
jgi:hypothetical protein